MVRGRDATSAARGCDNGYDNGYDDDSSAAHSKTGEREGGVATTMKMTFTKNATFAPPPPRDDTAAARRRSTANEPQAHTHDAALVRSLPPDTALPPDSRPTLSCESSRS